VRGLPGVLDVAAGSDAPLRDSYSASVLRRQGHPDDRIRYYRHAVSAGYFRTLGIPIVRGRGFDAGDRPGGPGVAVISKAFAARLFPGVDALGKRLLIGRDTATIVGIAGNVHFRDLTTNLMDTADDPDLYFSEAQVTPRTFTVLVRSAAEPGALAAQTALVRLISFLLGLFATLSLVLAVVGLYGVTSYVVRGRRQEIAIRLAIGARPATVRWLVLRQSLTVIGVGLLVGGGAALVATWLPATQASRVEPRATLTE
jgi:putative ABC transport system permease protein